MKKARLIFGSTNSQPVGTPEARTEEVYQRSYKPFLRVLYNTPDLPVTLHYSGHLLQWLERHHSEYTDVLAEMVGRRQVELLGGGFYDPLLPLIPRADRIGQVESLTTYLRKRFGRRPRGSWITEQAWEPSLASMLKSSGMEYTFLDDYHFIVAGFCGDDLHRPCVTEDQGRTIIVFPLCYDLVRLSRTSRPEAVIRFLKERANDDPSRVFALLDEGERYPRVSAAKPAEQPAADSSDGWLERFVELLIENREWLDVQLPSAYLREVRPRRRGYFAPVCYEELATWSVNAERKQAYDMLRARFAGSRDGRYFSGHLRQHLARHAESNLMYAKMQYAHVLVNQIRGDKYRKQAAREELWRGQCHTAYWQGHGPGIHDNQLRKHVYRALIEAEKKAREKGIFSPSVVTVDFDLDGLEEFLYQGQDLNAYVHQEAGMMFELDYLPACWNYLDTMSRRPEPGGRGEAPHAGYDRFLRKAFLDHFYDPTTTLEEFDRGEAADRGSFLGELYTRADSRRDNVIALSATGRVDGAEGSCAVAVGKRYTFRRMQVQVDYEVKNTGETALAAVFCPEINLAFLSQGPEALRLYVRSGREQPREVGPGPSSHADTSEIRMEDLVNEVSLTLGSGQNCELWIVPVETVLDGAGDPLRLYQGTSLLARYPLELSPDQVFALSLTLKFEKG